MIDVTAKVDFQLPDDETLPLTQCVCGATFHPWNEIVSIYADHPWECPSCKRKLIFQSGVRVYELTADSTPKPVETPPAPVGTERDVMSDAAQQRALATLEGWTHTDAFTDEFKEKWWDGHEIGLPPSHRGKQPTGGNLCELPDYLNHLDLAIALVRHWYKTQPGKWEAFERHLEYFVGEPVTAMDIFVGLSARQICEALLRAADLWRNDA